MAVQAHAETIGSGFSFQNLIHQLQTPETITRFMWKYFRVESDQRQFGTEEYWQSPEELLRNRQGDCEDFAIFAHQILKSHGWNSFLMNIYGGRFPHTVCVFKENGTYHVIDGTDLIRTKTTDLKALISEIDPFWKEGAIVTHQKNSKQGRIVSHFEKRLRAMHRMATSA